MKKILVFTSIFGKPYFGGAEASISEFYKSLAELDSEILICTLDKQFANFPETVEFRNIQIKRFSTWLPHPVIERNESPFVLRLFSHFLGLSIGMRPFAVVKEFWNVKPDLVITHNLAGWGYVPWIVSHFLGIPVIHDNRDLYLVCIQTTKWKPKKGLCAKTCRECIPRLVATKLAWKGGVMVTNSQYLKLEIEKNLNQKRNTHFEIVYPPIRIAANFNTASQTKYDAVFVGRLEESKGIREFLMASRGKGLIIGIAGVGELREELEAEFPEVRFLGQVDGPSLMSQSRILVVPSLWNETFGRVALEGIAAGIPVLHSNRGGLGEFKSRDGSVIIEINPEDTENFALQIDLALTKGKNEKPLETEWLESHYDHQISKFKALVRGLLDANL